MKEIMTIDDALRAVAEAKMPADLLRIANTADAMRHYARRSMAGLLAQNRCAEIRLRAERRLGEMLAEHVHTGRPRTVTQGDHFRLAYIGVTKRMSGRAQQLAEILSAIFNTFIAEIVDSEDELTARGLILHAERRTHDERSRQRIRGGAVADL